MPVSRLGQTYGQTYGREEEWKRKPSRHSSFLQDNDSIQRDQFSEVSESLSKHTSDYSRRISKYLSIASVAAGFNMSILNGYLTSFLTSTSPCTPQEVLAKQPQACLDIISAGINLVNNSACRLYATNCDRIRVIQRWIGVSFLFGQSIGGFITPLLLDRFTHRQMLITLLILNIFASITLMVAGSVNTVAWARVCGGYVFGGLASTIPGFIRSVTPPKDQFCCIKRHYNAIRCGCIIALVTSQFLPQPGYRWFGLYHRAMGMDDYATYVYNPRTVQDASFTISILLSILALFSVVVKLADIDSPESRLRLCASDDFPGPSRQAQCQEMVHRIAEAQLSKRPESSLKDEEIDELTKHYLKESWYAAVEICRQFELSFYDAVWQCWQDKYFSIEGFGITLLHNLGMYCSGVLLLFFQSTEIILSVDFIGLHMIHITSLMLILFFALAERICSCIIWGSQDLKKLAPRIKYGLFATIISISIYTITWSYGGILSNIISFFLLLVSMSMTCGSTVQSLLNLHMPQCPQSQAVLSCIVPFSAFMLYGCMVYLQRPMAVLILLASVLCITLFGVLVISNYSDEKNRPGFQ